MFIFFCLFPLKYIYQSIIKSEMTNVTFDMYWFSDVYFENQGWDFSHLKFQIAQNYHLKKTTFLYVVPGINLLYTSFCIIASLHVLFYYFSTLIQMLAPKWASACRLRTLLFFAFNFSRTTLIIQVICFISMWTNFKIHIPLCTEEQKFCYISNLYNNFGKTGSFKC